MTKQATAKIAAKAFNLLLDKESWKATKGSDKAALNVIRYLTAKTIVLRNLGFMTDDNGKLVKFKPIEDKTIELVKRAKDGDPAAAKELLDLLTIK